MPAIMTAIAVILLGHGAAHCAREPVLRVAAGERRAADQQRSHEDEDHWTFHLYLLDGFPSIRCGTSIVSPS
jgi:hypothetical protein